MIKVLVADDHEVVRTGIVSLFKDTDIKVVAEASCGCDAIKMANKLKPDVVLLGYSHARHGRPGSSGTNTQ